MIKALLTHPMENGLKKSLNGELVPAHYITEISLRINGEVVTTMLTGSGIAANPLFGWRVAGVRRGDIVTIAWLDNLGNGQAKDTSAQ